MKKLRNAKDVEAMSQEEALQWLLDNDREGARHWSTLPLDSTDFKEAVLDNLRDFGFETEDGTEAP